MRRREKKRKQRATKKIVDENFTNLWKGKTELLDRGNQQNTNNIKAQNLLQDILFKLSK